MNDDALSTGKSAWMGPQAELKCAFYNTIVEAAGVTSGKNAAPNVAPHSSGKLECIIALICREKILRCEWRYRAEWTRFL